VDLANEMIATTAYNTSSVYDSVTSSWAASTVWEAVDNVDLQESLVSGVASATQPAMITFTFKSGGQVTTTGTTWSVLIKSKDASVLRKLVLTLSNVTGRAQIKQL